MEITLVVNPGSSSKKYAFYEGDKLLLSAKYEKTSDGYASCVSLNKDITRKSEVDEFDYREALGEAIKTAFDNNLINENKPIKRVGVRVVAPGSYFLEHKLIDDRFVAELEKVAATAPLHIPVLLEEIKSLMSILPEAQLYAASDSAFHSTIPDWRQKYTLFDATDRGIRRYGYHGLSVASVARRLNTVFKDRSHSKCLVLHVGNGISATALLEGASVSNSMGYTPASGLVMGSRSGDMDPGALIEFLRVKNISGVEAQTYFQQNGGLKGVLGNSDIRSMLERVSQKDSLAIDTLSLFVEKIQQTILSYAVTLRGIDSIVLTGTAVERNPDLRKKILKDLPLLKLSLDEDLNEQIFSKTEIISDQNSSVCVAVITTDEMGEIARTLV